MFEKTENKRKKRTGLAHLKKSIQMIRRSSTTTIDSKHDED